MRCNLFLRVLTLMLCVGFSVNSFSATELKLSHAYTDGDSRDLWAHKIAEIVSQKTDGEVVVKIYPNQQISKVKQQAQMVSNGRIDMAIYPLPWLSGKAPITEIAGLPGLVSTAVEGATWRDKAIWPMLEDAVKGTGSILAGGGWALGTIGSSSGEITVPSDLEGHKIRGLGKASEAMFRAKGATVTSISAAETYHALQTGTLDSLLTIYDSFDGYNLHEVVSHMLVGPGLVGAMHGLLVSPTLEQKIGKENYEKVLDSVKESEPWFAKMSDRNSKTISEEFEKMGVKTHEITKDELKLWQKAAKESAWQYFIKNTPNGAKALESVGIDLTN